jgi:predicted phosphodiesterase
MRIAYMSDLHFDFHLDYGKEFLETLEVPECDLLVVAGDLMDVSIVSPEAAFKTFCKKAPKVLYVAGNHESYHTALRWSDNEIEKIVKLFPQVTFASKAKILTSKEIPSLGNLTLLAGSLWFQDYPDQAEYKKFLNDFALIKDLEPEIYQRNKEFDILLHGIKDEPCVVVSHHLPSYQSVNAKYAGSALNRFFVGNEYAQLIADSKIKCWIHGHCHDAVDYKIGDTRILSNAFGCPHEVAYNWQVRTVDI